MRSQLLPSLHSRKVAINADFGSYLVIKATAMLTFLFKVVFLLGIELQPLPRVEQPRLITQEPKDVRVNIFKHY